MGNTAQQASTEVSKNQQLRAGAILQGFLLGEVQQPSPWLHPGRGHLQNPQGQVQVSQACLPEQGASEEAAEFVQESL